MRSIEWLQIADKLVDHYPPQTTPFSTFCNAFRIFLTGEVRQFIFGG